MVVDTKVVKAEYDSLLQELANPEVVSDWEKFQALSRKKTKLEKLLEKLSAIEETRKQIEENNAILTASEDRELNILAQQELGLLQDKVRKLEEEAEVLFSSSDEADKIKVKGQANSVIMEIRAGVGGEESALFAQDLFGMYSAFSKFQGWEEHVLDTSQSDLGGFKEIIFELRPGFKCGENCDVFSKMKYEAGVHRVQRIPATEKAGRVHTSTATVAVLLKPKASGEFKINPNEIKVDFFNATGPGGQNVNKRKTAVRITHLPSGMVVTSRTERSQLQNKESALAILSAKLLEQSEMAKEEQVLGIRNSQIGWAKRAEKIRTYNFPQSRITDHRIKKSWQNLEEILEGKLEDIIETLQKNLGKNG
jgi:peptide chain release factor 1